jgi:hypothetical protein
MDLNSKIATVRGNDVYWCKESYVRPSELNASLRRMMNSSVDDEWEGPKWGWAPYHKGGLVSFGTLHGLSLRLPWSCEGCILRSPDYLVAYLMIDFEPLPVQGLSFQWYDCLCKPHNSAIVGVHRSHSYRRIIQDVLGDRICRQEPSIDLPSWAKKKKIRGDGLFGTIEKKLIADTFRPWVLSMPRPLR